MTSVIFYGCGANLDEKYDQFTSKYGIPLCYVDADHNKIGKEYREREAILSLKEATTKYPDYTLYLTQAASSLLAVKESLLKQGIPEERIRFCEDVEYRLGCAHIGQWINVSAYGIDTCCNLQGKGYIDYRNEVQNPESIRNHVNAFLEKVDCMLEGLRRGSAGRCEGCISLKPGLWPRKPKIQFMIAGGSFRGTICNARCIYCNQRATAFTSQTIQTMTGYEVYKTMVDIFGNQIKRVDFADGEITVLPHCNELLDLAIEQRWDCNVCTNAIIYNNKIKKIMKNKGSYLNVSLDSGTKETYKKVKGIDAFEKVTRNIEEYASDGGRISLKYILMPKLNDSSDDFDGFTVFAKKVEAFRVQVSQDRKNFSENELVKSWEHLSDYQYEKYKELVQKLKDAGLKPEIAVDNFSPSDSTKLNELIYSND